MPGAFWQGVGVECLLQIVAAVVAGRSAAGCLPAVGAAGDWTRLRTLARWHRCEGLLHAALNGAPADAVPPAQSARARGMARGAAVRAVGLERELLRIRNRFSGAGIHLLALKGPAIARLAYAETDHRQYDDLDLLLAPDQVAPAARLLVADGYQPLTLLTETQICRQARAGWDYSLRQPDTGNVVELCVGVAPAFFVAPMGPAVAERAITVDVGGVPVSAPCCEDLLILLSIHGAKHMWSRLIWVADVAGLLLRHGDAVDGAHLVRTARAMGCERMLRLAVCLARDLTPALRDPLPAPAAAETRVRRRAQAVVCRWRAGVCTEPSGKDELLFHLAVRERWRDRIRHGVRLAVTPGYGDWRWVRLPEYLYGLYYLLRPLRLAGVACLRAAGRRSERATLRH